ncbi:MAG: hypothetical protein JWP97_4037 [Labilithrix sp.]|nr:hypothetical protein [Labilithrix sp.]
MNDERSPESALRGRLADIFVPALLEGSVDALSRRLGDRATVDDTRHGSARGPADIAALLGRIAGELVGASYEHRASTTGGDRDAAEGALVSSRGGVASEMPIAIVAERRRLREIEIRIYRASLGTGAPTSPARLRSIVPPAPGSQAAERAAQALGAPPVGELLDALRRGDAEGVAAGLERGARLVDAAGGVHAHESGALAAHLRERGAIDLEPLGSADDGRTACIEALLRRGNDAPAPAFLAIERGDSGLVREIRLYFR